MHQHQHSQDKHFDIDLGNKCSANAFMWAKKTFVNRDGKMGEVVQDMDGLFSNMISFDSLRIGISSDGIGTKIELAERTRIYNTLGHDLMAMVVDDLVCGGFVPTNISNIIDVDKLDYDTINSLMSGLYDAAAVARVAITGGEIAELGSRIGGYGEGMHFNWCATAIGTLHPLLDAPINGRTIAKDDVIIALSCNGLRSNGFSVARKILAAQFGDQWHVQPYTHAHTTTGWGEVLLSPSVIFTPLIVHLLDSQIIPKGIAHITGGGIADNLQRILKTTNSGAYLPQLAPPPPFVTELQAMGELKDEEAYLYWNMGNAMLVIVSPADADKVLQASQVHGYKAKIAGKIIEQRHIAITTHTGAELHITY